MKKNQNKFKIKVFIKKNKAVITLIILLGGGYYMYNSYESTIESTLEFIQIPVTTGYLESGTIITEEHIQYIKYPSIVDLSNINLNESDIIGRVVDNGASLATNSMFYKELVVEPQEIDDISFLELGVNEIAINIEVDEVTSYNNSIKAGHNIDLFFSGTGIDVTTLEEKIVYGELIKNIRVVDVNTNIDSQDQILVLAMSYADADLVGRAKVFGDVFPVASYSSINESEAVNYYDLELMKDAIYQRTIDIKLQPVSEENVDG